MPSGLNTAIELSNASGPNAVPKAVIKPGSDLGVHVASGAGDLYSDGEEASDGLWVGENDNVCEIVGEDVDRYICEGENPAVFICRGVRYSC